jgi:cytochrome c oxidase assembly protein subunit 15
MSSLSFYRLSLSTLVAVYLLILVGGIVRSTGSGMGCPDWPKCFGQWVPPTSVSQLPDDYKEIYSSHRHEKNVRFVKYLNALGFESTAEKILTDESIRQEADFNPVKTWIEYINRLIGVVIGLLIVAVFIFSLRYWNTRRNWTIMAFLTFVLVGFQGWIGSIVVSTNLTPWTITLHMFLALVIVAMLVYLVHQAKPVPADQLVLRGSAPWLVGSLLVLVVQILLGTQVREALDKVAAQLMLRSDWISSLGLPFVIHRSFSWIVLLVHSVLIYRLLRDERSRKAGVGLILLVLGTVLTGTGMAYLAVPPVLQPLHLLLASVTFGTLFLLTLRLKRKPETALS